MWEGKWLLPHLLVQAVLCGAVAIQAVNPAAWTFFPRSVLLFWLTVVLATLAHCAIAVREVIVSHPTDNSRQAAAFLSQIKIGPINAWINGVTVGTIATIVVAAVFPALTFVPALIGLFLYEYAFIRAGRPA